MTRDSIDYINYPDPQTLNLYAYCGNNPVSRTDPTGQGWLDDFWNSVKEFFGSHDDDSDDTSEDPALRDAIEPVSLWDNVMFLSMFTGAGEVGLTGKAAVQSTKNLIEEFLGKGYKMIYNEAGDMILRSADGLRRVRFDIKRPYPHENPHFHLDELIKGKWRTWRIWTKDVEPK